METRSSFPRTSRKGVNEEVESSIDMHLSVSSRVNKQLHSSIDSSCMFAAGDRAGLILDDFNFVTGILKSPIFVY